MTNLNEKMVNYNDIRKEVVEIKSGSKLYIFEGPDGAGKSTLLDNISIKLHDFYQSNKNIVSVKLPAKSYFGYETLKKLLKSNFGYPVNLIQSLFSMNIIDFNLRRLNDYFKENNNIILSDRGALSNIIYGEIYNGSISDNIYDWLSYNFGFKWNRVTFDIILKYYYHFKGILSKVFIILPPLHIVVKHAELRNKMNTNLDSNDKLENIINVYNGYSKFIKENRLIVDDNNNLFDIIDYWDYDKTEAENYSKIEEIIIDKILGNPQGRS